MVAFLLRKITRYKKTQVTLQDNTKTTNLAAGAPVSSIVLLNDGDNLMYQKSGLSNRLLN